jgi:chorismate mutase
MSRLIDLTPGAEHVNEEEPVSLEAVRERIDAADRLTVALVHDHVRLASGEGAALLDHTGRSALIRRNMKRNTGPLSNDSLREIFGVLLIIAPGAPVHNMNARAMEAVDTDLVGVLNGGVRLAEQAGDLKREVEQPIQDETREATVIENVLAANHGIILESELKELFQILIRERRERQYWNAVDAPTAFADPPEGSPLEAWLSGYGQVSPDAPDSKQIMCRMFAERLRGKGHYWRAAVKDHQTTLHNVCGVVWGHAEALDAQRVWLEDKGVRNLPRLEGS